MNQLTHMLACFDPECPRCGSDPAVADGPARPREGLPERVAAWDEAQRAAPSVVDRPRERAERRVA